MRSGQAGSYIWHPQVQFKRRKYRKISLQLVYRLLCLLHVFFLCSGPSFESQRRHMWLAPPLSFFSRFSQWSSLCVCFWRRQRRRRRQQLNVASVLLFVHFERYTDGRLGGCCRESNKSAKTYVGPNGSCSLKWTVNPSSLADSGPASKSTSCSWIYLGLCSFIAWQSTVHFAIRVQLI